MNNKLLLELLRETGQGNFKWVHSKIISNMLELDENTAARIIVECCRIFYKSETPIVDEENLVKVLLTCKQFIQKLSDDVFQNYLQSLFFILKFWLKQKRYELVFGIKSLLVCQFMDYSENIKLVTLCTNLSSLIHNAVVDLRSAETSENNTQVYYQLCALSLQLKSLHVPTNMLLANTAYSYFNSPILLTADMDLEYNCYLAVLPLLKPERNSGLSDIYSATAKILDIVIRNLFKQRKFHKIREYMEVTILAIKKLSLSKVYHKLFDILYHSSQIVVELEEFQNSPELLTSHLEECLKDVKYFLNNFSFPPEFEKLFHLLYLIFFNLLDYYANVNPTIWNTVMEEHTQIVMCNLLGIIGKIFSQIKGECRFCSSCKVKNNLYSAFIMTALTGNLLKISINNQESVSKSLCCYVFPHLEHCCLLIKKLHNQECLRWKSALTDCGIMIYNIAVKLYLLKHDESFNYFVLLIKNVIHLENTVKSAIFKSDVLGLSLQCLSEMSIRNYQFKEALMYAAIGILVSCDSSKAYKMWVNAKAQSKENDIEENCCLQQLTIVCVLQKCDNEIKHLYPDLKLDAEITRRLLMEELAYYKAVWKSKIPMKAAFTKLCNVTDLLTLVKTIINTWAENPESADSDVIKLINEITFKFKLETEKNVQNKDSSQNTEEQIYLGLLYIVQYYTQSKILRQKTADDINSTVIPEQAPLPPHEIPKNPNDECDMVTSYSSLKLDEYLKVMKLLNEGLILFNICVSDCTSLMVTEILKQQNLFNVVVKVAHEFRLHRDSVQAIQAWFLCLKISRLMDNNLYILQSISFLIEETNMDAEVICELLTEADNLENDLTPLGSPEIWTVLTTYHINKSVMLLRHQNVQAGFKEYQRATECFQQLEENKDELLEIRLDFLHTWYLQLPCNLQIEGHNVFSLAKCHKVLNRITKYVKDSDHAYYSVTIIFEVYQAVAHMYRWMCLPREVRCYCRDIVMFAQELVIPLQTAYFLIYLAHADLLSTRLDDCQVKLDGLSDLLCLDNKIKNPSCKEMSTNIPIEKKDVDVSKLVDDFAEIMLDCPSTDYKYKCSPGSPVLFLKPFTQPSFLKHSIDCNCFYCVSVEYKILILEYINLEAQLLILRGNTSAAQACFTAGLQFYQNICKNDSFKNKITNQFSCYVHRDWEDTLCQSICALLLNYANSLLRTNDVKKAELFNRKLLNLMCKRKYENFFMYNEALQQKYLIVGSMCKNNGGDMQDHLQVNKKLIHSRDLKGMPKTPENQQTKIIIKTSYSPRPNSPPKRQLRRIKCDFSDKPENSHKPSGTEQFDLTNEKKNMKLLKSPIQKVCKTPSPICSGGYDPPTIKTIKKYKPQLQGMATPLPKKIAENCSNGTADQNISGIIPSSPSAYTPNALQVSSALKSRTDLLTRKLKKSTVKKENASKEDNRDNNSQTEVKENICKNLMSELSASEDKIIKPLQKKKTRNISNATTNQLVEQINTRRNTRANSKAVNK